jgi:hypothetical protein
MSLSRAQLPVRLTPLVGRESELSDIVDAVGRSRLITLASWLQRDFARAAAEARTALAIFRDLGDVEGIAWSLISLGTVARYQGDGERAAELLAESLSLSEGIGFREGIAWAVEQLGLLAAAEATPPEAEGTAGEAGAASRPWTTRTASAPPPSTA